MPRLEFDTSEARNNFISALQNVGIEAVRELQKTVPVATGFLRDSIWFEIVQSGNEITLEFSMAKYWKYVEWGHPPHIDIPKLQDIVEWCRVKGIDEKYAFPIWRRIITEGTRPQPFIRPFMNTKFIPLLNKNLGQAFK